MSDRLRIRSLELENARLQAALASHEAVYRFVTCARTECLALRKESRDEIQRLRTVTQALILAWDHSPELEGWGLEASFYDHLEELRELVDLRSPQDQNGEK